MKTQVIHLDMHDDVTSVRDKMSWAKTERILLVFPPHSHILARRLDLRLLQRHAAMLGTQLAVVTRSSELRRAAEETNIPDFRTTASAQRQAWERELSPSKPQRLREQPNLRRMREDVFPPEPHWRSNIRLRILLFTLAILAVFAVVTLFIPTANIQLAPEPRQQNLTFTISANPKATTVNLAGSLPARLTSMVVEHSKTVSTTGSVSIPDLRAKGIASFRNLTMTQAIIPAGTVVSTRTSPPIRFVTMEDAVIAAGAGKTMDVPVQAIEAGSAGNVPADALIAFEEEHLGTTLSVTNPKPMEGGSDRTAAIQTAEDRSIVHESLLAEILDECKGELAQTLSAGDIFFPDTPTVSQILSETYFPAESQSGDTLSLTMRLQCQAQYASIADITKLVEMSLDANLPRDYSPASERLMILPGSVPVTDDEGTTSWDVKTQRLLYARVDPLNAVQLSLGHRPAEAAHRLEENLPLARKPIITLTPPWWPWMPAIPFRITVTTLDGETVSKSTNR